MRVELVKTYDFEAAHSTAWNGGEERLHGHSFRVEVVVAGECDPRLGWLIDYAEITERFDPLYRRLDHKTLNDIEGLEEPTLAGIRAWILNGLRPQLDCLQDVRVSIVGEQVFSPKLLHAAAELRLPERLRFGFEAAHALPNLPRDHKCHALHGHSFVVEVAGGVPQLLTPRLHALYEQLDHRCLNEIQGLENPTSEALAGWIWKELSETTPGLEAVIVAETCTARCVYYGE